LALPAALARRGIHVLLVDLDPQASATKVLGVDVAERRTWPTRCLSRRASR
jgi:cellulose biosynthesis protein BcsQ